MANTNIIGDILRAFWDFLDDIKTLYADSKERNIQSIEILDADNFKLGKAKVYKDAGGKWIQKKEGRDIQLDDGLVREIKTGRPWVILSNDRPYSLNFKALRDGLDKAAQGEILDRVAWAVSRKTLFKPSIDPHANIGLLAGVIIAFLLGFILKGFMK